jgi:acetyl-CoA carboxylase carboxyltransferase component
MATGEIADAEELGGADMHSSVTGLSDQLATDEYVSLFLRPFFNSFTTDSMPFERRENGC